MPYIKQEDRDIVDNMSIREINELGIKLTVGELNYFITRLVHSQLKEMSYTQANNLIGALECAKLELYRRKVAPYEDIKIIENGDVI